MSQRDKTGGTVACVVQVLTLAATTTSSQPRAESVSENLRNHPVTCEVYHMFVSTLHELRIIEMK